MIRNATLLTLTTALSVTLISQDAVANDKEITAAVENCSAGMIALRSNMYKYPAPIDSWRTTFTTVKQNNYPSCLKVGTFLAENADNPDVVRITSMMASDNFESFNDYLTGRNGVFTNGQRFLSYCPTKHRAQFDCTGGNRLTNTVLGAEKILAEIGNISLDNGYGGVVVEPGSELERGKKYYSSSEGHYLLFQDDNNVVVYTAAGQPVWATQTIGLQYRTAGIGRVKVQSDGNFAFYRDDNTYIWSALHQAQPTGTSLHLGDDGKLRIIKPDGSIVWTS